MDETRASVRSIPVVVVAVALAVAAVVPTGDGLARTGPLGLGLDLWLHAAGYLCLQSALLYAVTGDRVPVGAPPTPLLTVGYGVLLEGVQLLVPHRGFSVADMVANAAGVLVALAVYGLLSATALGE